MNKKSIEKLRKRLIFTTTLSFVAVIFLMGALIYLANLLSTNRNCRIQIDRIIRNGGIYPTGAAGQDMETESAPQEETAGPAYSPSVRDLLFPGEDSTDYLGRYEDEVHYFTVFYDPEGVYEDAYIHDAYVQTKQLAVSYADEVMDRFFSYGRYDRYYYKVASDENGTMVVFLDSTDLLNNSNRLLYISLILMTFGMIVTFLLVRIFSYKLIQPEIENAERQKQFITNASHELKTPLAVIRANTEVEQMISGENEWNTSTMRQIDRLTGLIENLVLISRAEERDNAREAYTESDLTRAVTETVDTFRSILQQDGKALSLQIGEGVSMLADEGDIRQLTSLLLDNAIKYCDEGGTVGVSLYQKGKTTHLVVANSYAEGANVDYRRFFDRFYRQEEAHSANREKGGFGIGLSIAESLTSRYHGRIDVSWKEGMIYFHCLLKPVR